MTSPVCDEWWTRHQLGHLATQMEEEAVERVQALGAPPIVGLSVLSCFDGIGCVAQALQQAGVPVARYEAVDNDAEDAGVAAMAEHMNPATERFAGISLSLIHI